MLDETIFIISAELTRFNKRAEVCETELDRMMYVLKNSEKLDAPSGWLANPVYARILKAFEIPKFSEAKRLQYNKDMYDERRRIGEMKAAKQDGLEEGMAIGLVRGREEGKEEGLQLGALQERRAIAKKLIETGQTVSDVSGLTGLSEEEIRNL